MIEIIVLGLVVIYLGFSNYIEKERNYKREKDLLNRLMSRDMNEYAGNTVYMQDTKKPVIDEDTLMQERERLLDKMHNTLPVD